MASIRADGRTASDIRPITIQLGQLARADGSARFGFGSTACMSSFTGPIEVRIREEMPDKATLEVSHRPLGAVGGAAAPAGEPIRMSRADGTATPSRALEAALESAFTPLLALGQHPRSLLQLVVQSLSAPLSSFEDLSSSASQRRNDEYRSFDDSADDAGDDDMSGAAGKRDVLSKVHTWPKPAKVSASSNSDGSSSSNNMGAAPSTQISFSERAAALNSASLAILDSGAVATSGVLVAISAALVGAKQNAYAYVDTATATNGQGQSGDAEELDQDLILDPTPEEEGRAVARFGFAWAFGKGLSTVKQPEGQEEMEGTEGMEQDGQGQRREAALVWVDGEGRFTRDQFKHAMAAARDGAESILEVYRSELQKHLESRHSTQ